MKASRSCRVTTPTGLPSSWTSSASAFSSRCTASDTGSLEATGGSGGGRVPPPPAPHLARVTQLGVAREQRVEQRPLRDAAGHLRGNDRRLRPDDGHLRDAVLLED